MPKIPIFTFDTIIGNLAYHSLIISSSPAPYKCGLHAGPYGDDASAKLHIEVNIEKYPHLPQQGAVDVWNHVTLTRVFNDGRKEQIYSGNRAGAVTCYATLCAKLIRDAAKDDRIPDTDI